MKLIVKPVQALMSVFSINPGNAFRHGTDYYIRLGANGSAKGSVNALAFASYAMNIKTGEIVVFQDETRVYPVKAECIVKEEGIDDEK